MNLQAKVKSALFNETNFTTHKLFCSLECMNLQAKVKSALNFGLKIHTFQATKEFMGGEVGLVEQSALNFGLKIHTFQSANGAMVKFIHEPALDLMTGFPVPYWKFGKANVSPRDILISIDTANIRND